MQNMQKLTFRIEDIKKNIQDKIMKKETKEGIIVNHVETSSLPQKLKKSQE